VRERRNGSGHLHLTKRTVVKWCGRFAERRLDLLLDEARPGVPRKIVHADVERVLTAMLESTPRDTRHWSTPSLDRHYDMSSFGISGVMCTSPRTSASWLKLVER